MNKKNVPAKSANERKASQMAANENNINEKNFSKITLKDNEGNRYTLEFNARIVKNMERKGFKVDTDVPVTMIEDLFLGALQMHHKGIMPERAKAIWLQQKKKDELLSALVKLYMKPLEDLMAEDETEDNEDPTWETV